MAETEKREGVGRGAPEYGRRIDPLLRYVSEAVLVLDAGGTVSRASPAAERMLGQNLTGTDILGCAHHQDAELISEAIAEIAEMPGGSASLEFRLRGEDDCWQRVEGSLSNALEDPDIGGLVLCFREVTGRDEEVEALRKSEAQYRALVENSMDALSICDPDNTWRYVSPSMERVLGYRPEELEGRPVPELVHPEDFERYGREIVEQIQAGSGPFKPVEGRYRHKDGSWRYMESTFNIMIDDPIVRGVVGSSRDITERVRMEQALRESEERLRLLFENSLDWISLGDADNVFRYVSPTVERLLGYKPEELVGTVISDLIHPEDLERAQSSVAEVQGESGPLGAYEFRYRHKDGSWRYLETNVNNLIEDPAVKSVVSVSRDITERKRMEEALKLSEERLRLLFENSLDVIALCGPDNTWRYLSPSVEQVLGYKSEELLGTVVSDLLHPEDLERAAASVGEVLDRPGPTEAKVFRYRHKDGSWRYLETVVNNRADVSRVGGIVCNLRDVTDRVRAEEALRESEEKLRLLFENSLDWISLFDAENKLLYVSPAVERALGYMPEDLVGTAISEIVHPDDLEYTARTAGEILDTSGPYGPLLARYRHKDRTWRWVETTINNLLDDPHVRGVVCTSRDVTERVRMERALKESEERFRSLVQNAPDLILVANADTTFKYVSPSTERVLGYRPEELLGTKATDFIHPGDRERAVIGFAKTAEDVGAIAAGGPIIRFRHKDGSWRHFEGQATNLLDDPAVQGLVFNSRDVTERIRAEKEIKRLNETLERRVRERTAQLEAAINDLEDSEHLLRDSLEHYALVVDGANVGTWDLDLSSEEVHWNDRFFEMLGLSPDAFAPTRESVVELAHPDDRRRVIEAMMDHVEHGGEYDEEVRLRHAAGGYRDCMVRARVHRDRTGRPLRIAGMVLDITDRKEAERDLQEAEARYRTLIEQIPAVTYIQDPHGDKPVLYVSPQIEDMLGYTPEEETSDPRHWVQTLHPDDRERVLAEDRRTDQTGEPFKMEYRQYAKDGSVVWVRDEAVLVRDVAGEPLYWQGVQFDVTEQKRAEQDLRRSLDSLIALYEAGHLLVSSLEVEEISHRLLEIARRVSGMNAAVIHLADELGRLRETRAVGPEGLLARARRTTDTAAARRSVVETGEAKMFHLREPDEQDRLGLCLPLLARDRLVGALEIYGDEAVPEQSSVEVLATLAGQAAGALENARLYEELSERERRLQELVRRLITAQEEEQRRIAYEVHDGLAQIVVGAHNRLQAFAGRHPSACEEGGDDLEQALALVQQSVTEARRVISDLRPTVLDDFGLSTALRMHAEELASDEVEIVYEESLGDERLPDVVETTLFRVAQEALTNVRKHSSSSEARLRLVRLPGAVRLLVRDWGCGFDPEEPLEADELGGRVGLSGMRERVSLLGGRFRVHSRPGSGTLVVAEVPLPEEV